MKFEEIEERFRAYALDTDGAERVNEVRQLCLDLALKLNLVVPSGREKALAMTHLEDVMHWANKAISRPSAFTAASNPDAEKAG